MAPRQKDVFLPGPDTSFTKGEVNRAGELLRKYFYTELDKPDSEWEMDKVVEGMFAVTWWKQQHARPLSRVAAALRYHVIEEGGEVEDKVDITQRLKKRDTIINKLDRFPRMQLTQMHDIGGVRARLPTLECVQAVSRRLKKTWSVAKTRDYIAEPKDTGYRAIHHDIRKSGRIIELQLRTVRQDAWANQVEDDGRTLGTGYKFGFGQEDVHDFYRLMGESFWLMDSGKEIPPKLQEELRDRYAKIRRVLRPQSP